MHTKTVKSDGVNPYLHHDFDRGHFYNLAHSACKGTAFF